MSTTSRVIHQLPAEMRLLEMSGIVVRGTYKQFTAIILDRIN